MQLFRRENMSEQSTLIQVTILDKEYQVNCPPSDQEALIKSARYLDESGRKIKGRATSTVLRRSR